MNPVHMLVKSDKPCSEAKTLFQTQVFLTMLCPLFFRLAQVVGFQVYFSKCAYKLTSVIYQKEKGCLSEKKNEDKKVTYEIA